MMDFPRNYQGTTPNHAPIIAHELGQWCAFPDLGETTQYTGVYKARNFEIFQDLLASNGMAFEWREFCSPLVPLAKFPKFVFSAGETLSVPVDVYNALHDTTACIHRLQPPDELKPALKAGTSMGE